jgi:hypothetical protein
MFKELRRDPVFIRLTAHSRWPSLPVTLVLYMVLAALPLAIIAEQIARTGRVTMDSSLVILVSLLVFMFSPAVFGIITSFMTAQYAKGDILPLMVVSGLNAGDIVGGYLAAALYRGRVLWAIYLTLPPFVCVLIAVTTATMPFNSPPLVLSDVPALVALWVWPVLAATILGIALNLLAICTALNFVLNDRRQWYGIASSLLISGTWGVGGLATLAGACLGVPLILAVVVLVLCGYSYNGAKNGVKRAVRRQIEVTT